MPTLNKKIAIKSYQKQHGLHHKVDKKYGKVYWPYLPVLLITALGLSLGLFITFRDQSIKSGSISYASLFSSTNQYRIKNGLSQLSYSKDLSTAAQSQANQIAVTNSWSPLNESKYPAFNLITTKSTNLSSPTENLAYGFGSSGSVVSAWSNSNYQDSNMLSPSSNSVGYGIVSSPSFMNSKNQKIVVAIFADNKTIPITVESKPNSYGLTPSVKSIAIIKFSSLIRYDNLYELYILGALMLVIALIILSKHTYLLHKWIKTGENVVIKHPLIDISLVVSFIILASAIQTTGYIS